MVFSKTLLGAVALLPLANAGFRGIRTDKAVHRRAQDDMTNDITNPSTNNNFCTPVPIFVGPDGLPRYTEDKVLIVFLEGNNTEAVDALALGATMGPAYNAAVDCSYSLGSIRELSECEVIPDVILSNESEAVLVKCSEYFTNSIDNSIFLSETDPLSVGTCECSCEGEDVFPVLLKNGLCECPCELEELACECFAPFIDTFISGWNTIYQNVTDSIDFTITIADVIEVTVLDPDDCESGEFTYVIDGNTICPGNGTAAFSSSFLPDEVTEGEADGAGDDSDNDSDGAGDLSASPTEAPSTEFPSEFPTEFPTDEPTLSPTESPTIAATPEPSDVTPEPTETPETDEPTEASPPEPAE